MQRIRYNVEYKKDVVKLMVIGRAEFAEAIGEARVKDGLWCI